MSERIIIAYDEGDTATIIEGSHSNTILGLANPAIIGIENPIAGQKKGGYLKPLGYTASHFMTSPDANGIRTGGIKVSPPMSAEHVEGLAELIAEEGYVFPESTETNFYHQAHPTCDAVTFVATVAPAQTRLTAEQIVEGFADAAAQREQRDYELAAGPVPANNVVTLAHQAA